MVIQIEKINLNYLLIMENLICTIFQWKNINSIKDVMIIHDKMIYKNNNIVLIAIFTSLNKITRSRKYSL